MTTITTAIHKLLTLILGQRLALRLGFYNPPHISPNNLIVHSYIHSIDGVKETENESDKQG